MESEMEPSDDSTARCFFKKFTVCSLIATTHLLTDIIPRITQLSLFFQKEIDIAMLQPDSADSVVQKRECMKRNGTYLSVKSI